MDMKKSFLEDTVNNIFRKIDKLRKTKLDSHYKNTEYRLSRIEEELGLADDEFVSFFTNKFEGDSDPDIWSTLLWDDNTGEILYASSELDTKNIEIAKKNIRSLVAQDSIFKKGNIKGTFGVKDSYIDDNVKKIFRCNQKSGCSNV